MLEFLGKELTAERIKAAFKKIGMKAVQKKFADRVENKCCALSAVFIAEKEDVDIDVLCSFNTQIPVRVVRMMDPDVESPVPFSYFIHGFDNDPDASCERPEYQLGRKAWLELVEDDMV